jgi:NAD+--dinitrogen-reductase ADP-D-ribosyltransferase
MGVAFGVGGPKPRASDPEARAYRSTYVKLLQGWGFDSNAPAGAVLKGWVESRFGIAPTFHKAPLEQFPSEAWMRYLEEKLSSRFHNNCILLQLDVLFEYAQFCLERFQPFGAGPHVELYRGAQRAEVQLLSGSIKERSGVIRLNNLVSFSLSRERAEEFGDIMLTANVPLAKLLFFPGLVQDRVLNGEGEALVLGGDFEVGLSYL